jgi:hypothetical protein
MENVEDTAALSAMLKDLETDLMKANSVSAGYRLMIEEKKAGVGDHPTLSHLEKHHDQSVENEAKIRGEIKRVRGLLNARDVNRKRIRQAEVIELGSKPARQEDVAVTASRNSTPVQRTLAGFVLVKGMDGRLRILGGEKTIAATLDTCTGCDKQFKNIFGLREHKRHCVELKKAELKLSTLGELKEVRADLTPAVADLGVLVTAAALNSAEVEAPPLAGATETGGKANEVIVLDDGDADPGSTAAKTKKKGARRGEDFRLTYSTKVKYRVAMLAEAAKNEASRKKGVYTVVADITGLPVSNIARWHKQRDLLRLKVIAAKGKKGRGNKGCISFSLGRGSPAHFPLAEQIVLARIERARGQGVRVGPTLVRSWMRRAVQDHYAGDLRAASFKVSRSWLYNFLNRHDLRPRRSTNKKDISVEDRLPKVRKWHKRFQRHVSQGDEEDPIFGRYKPANIMNSDQVPLCIADMMNATYDKRGKSTVRVAVQKNSDKRLATLQISVSLDGCATDIKPQCKPTLIFKGKGQISQDERDQYDARVTVMFQEKAWMDGDTFIRWVEGPLSAHVALLPPGKKIMILDNLRAQISDAGLEALRALGVERRLLPAGVTDIIQPIDQNVGVDVKRRMIEILNTRLAEDEEFLGRWVGQAGAVPFTARDRRILLTKILGEAWEGFCKAKDFRRLGLMTGCLMPKCGVDRAEHGLHDISIKGISDYAFEDVELEEDLREEEAETDSDDEEDGDLAVSEAVRAHHAVTSTSAQSACGQRDAGAKQKPAGNRDKGKRTTSVIPALEISQADRNASTDDDEVIQRDPDAADAILDDTVEDVGPAPNPPAGFVFKSLPLRMPLISRMIQRKQLVFWHARLPDGTSQGWIKAEVHGVPNDPSAVLQGITMKIKCNTRLDRNTPLNFATKHTCVVSVALSLNNYGRAWYLLRESNALASESDDSAAESGSEESESDEE